MNIYKRIARILKCQYSHWRKREWSFIQSHPLMQRFVFFHCRKWYTKLRYFATFGEPLNLHNPQSFHEKLFWLSVMYRHPLIMKCADKYRVREYISECGLSELLNTLYGVYDSAEQIPFEELPNRFVVKSNRGSGNNFFCLDKTKLNIPETIQLLNSWANYMYGVDTAEYQYARMPFKLCCEQHLLPPPPPIRGTN